MFKTSWPRVELRLNPSWHLSGSFATYGPLTNAGTISVTNGVNLNVYNLAGNPAFVGGIVNQGTGVINLWNNSSLLGQSYGSEYLINQGTINLMSGASTSSVNFFVVDLSAGTITTQPGTGTLQVGAFGGPGNLAGTYNAATNTTIQFTANASPGASPGTPLVLGGTGHYRFNAGLLTLPTDVIPNVTLTGGTLLLGPGFQGGAITNLTLNGINLTNTLPLTGTLTMTNGTMYGSVVVSNGAVLSANGATFAAQVTVQGGGEFLVTSSTTIGNGSVTNTWLSVQNGGLVQMLGSLATYGPLTNAGTINLTNGFSLTVYNSLGNAAYTGGLVNQANGVVNLGNNSTLNGTSFGNEYLINLGIINMISGSSSSVNFSSVDLSAGTINNQTSTGTLSVGMFNGLGSLTGTYNASGNSIIKFLASASPGTSAGSPLVLGGTGQYQFSSGLLTLPSNPIANVVMTGGTLLLGPGFQGGSITNLTLNGISVTNTLPVMGTLTMTNGTMYGSVVVSNGAVLWANGATFQAQVTVQGGGEFLVTSSTTFGNGSATNIWLSVQNGGLLQMLGSLTSYGPLTNAGTINLTNGFSLTVYNSSGNPAYTGGIVNQASGVINLGGNSTLNGTSYGNEYLINQGLISMLGGSSSALNVINLTNQATVSVQHGTLQIQSTYLSLQASETLDVGMTSPSDVGKFNIVGTAPLNGALAVNLNNGYIPAVGTSNLVVSYSPLSGSFTAFNLPDLLPARVWQPVYNNAGLSLLIRPPAALTTGGTNLVVSINSVPGHQAILLTSTDAGLPRSAWTPVSTNTFDVTTYLGFTNTVDYTIPAQFFTFRLP